MGRGVTPQSFVELFCGRVRTAIKESGYSNAEVAKALGVEVDTLRRYQTRLLMPHHLIHSFCDLMGIKPEFLLREPPVTIEHEPQRRIANESRRVARPELPIKRTKA